MCEERRNDNAECNELFGYLWLRKLIVPYFNRHNRNYCLRNMYSVCNSLLNVLLCCAVCVVTSWSPLHLILPAEFRGRCTDVISSNRWKHKAPCTKKCDVCEVKYWLQSRFRPSSAIQTKQILFIFFHKKTFHCFMQNLRRTFETLSFARFGQSQLVHSSSHRFCSI